MKTLLSIVLLLGSMTTFAILPVSAQGVVQVKCGDKLRDQFTKKLGNTEYKTYSIGLQAGMILEVHGIAVGTTLKFGIGIGDVANQLIGSSGRASTAPSAKTEVVSASLDHFVYLTNNAWRGDYAYGADGVGDFSLEFKCYGSDGKEVGSNRASSPTPLANKDSKQLLANTRGFPGLPAISFEEIESVPLDLGQPENIVITTKSNEIKAYEFEAKAGSIVDLSFVRKSGNLNLGLVVISNDNKVIYQASLVTASAMNAKFALPSAGKYIIGIFKIDLLQVISPIATKFEITTKLG